MNQEKLAKALGVSQPTVSYWMTGKTKPSEAMLEKIKSISLKAYERIMSAEDTSLHNITRDYLLSIFQYHDDGTLTWKVRSKNSKIGDKVGYLCKDGYLHTSIHGKQTAIHRLIWLIHYGYVPENVIDHINRNKADNRIENLREVSRVCNSANVEKGKMSGVTGVTWDRNLKLWTAQLNGEDSKLFLDFDEAVYHRFMLECENDRFLCIESSAYEHLNRLKGRKLSTCKTKYTIEDLKIFDYGRK